MFIAGTRISLATAPMSGASDVSSEFWEVGVGRSSSGPNRLPSASGGAASRSTRGERYGALGVCVCNRGPGSGQTMSGGALVRRSAKRSARRATATRCNRVRIQPPSGTATRGATQGFERRRRMDASTEDRTSPPAAGTSVRGDPSQRRGSLSTGALKIAGASQRSKQLPFCVSKRRQTVASPESTGQKREPEDRIA